MVSLTVLIIFLGVTLYVRWLWSRRKLYLYSYKTQGPFSWPLIGCLPLFIGTKADADVLLNSPKALAKDECFRHAEAFIGQGLVHAPVHIWKKHKKLIIPLFNQRNLDGFVEIFAQKAQILVGLLETQCNKRIDIFIYMSRAALDTLCETGMGVNLNAQTGQTEFGNWVARAMELVFLRIMNPQYYYNITFNLSSLKKEWDDLQAKILKFSNKVVDEQRLCYDCEGRSKNRKDLLHNLIQYTYSTDNSRLTSEELRQEAITFLVAGSDTTANTNSFILMIFGMFPDIQKRVYQEVSDILGQKQSVSYTDLPYFQYLECVIKETLRIFPVAPFLIRAIGDDIDLGDMIIPGGSSTFISVLNIHRNAEYWIRVFNVEAFFLRACRMKPTAVNNDIDNS